MSLSFESKSIKRPIKTEPENSVCGDETLIMETDTTLVLSVFDGAGHGLLAHRIAKEAMNFINENMPQREAFSDLLYALHEKLKRTVGGVVGFFYVDKSTGSYLCTGVGNITVRLFSNETKNLFFHGGVLGYEMVRPKLHQGVLKQGDIVVLHSDGVDERLSQDEIDSLRGFSSEVIAQAIIDYHSKILDDASVIVLKVNDDSIK